MPGGFGGGAREFAWVPIPDFDDHDAFKKFMDKRREGAFKPPADFKFPADFKPPADFQKFRDKGFPFADKGFRPDLQKFRDRSPWPKDGRAPPSPPPGDKDAPKPKGV